MTSQYPVRPPRWFNKKVWYREEARFSLQKEIGLARPMNSIILQQMGAHPNLTFQTQILLQLCKQFKMELSPDNVLTLLPDLDQQRLAVSADSQPMAWLNRAF